MAAGDLSDTDFRKKVNDTFQGILDQFDEVDPDLIEADLNQGSLILSDPKRKFKYILSVQPTVCQIWLAVSSLGKAHHFNWDAANSSWICDKNSEVELKSIISKYLLKSSLFNIQL